MCQCVDVGVDGDGDGDADADMGLVVGVDVDVDVDVDVGVDGNGDGDGDDGCRLAGVVSVAGLLLLYTETSPTGVVVVSCCPRTDVKKQEIISHGHWKLFFVRTERQTPLSGKLFHVGTRNYFKFRQTDISTTVIISRSLTENEVTALGYQILARRSFTRT